MEGENMLIAALVLAVFVAVVLGILSYQLNKCVTSLKFDLRQLDETLKKARETALKQGNRISAMEEDWRVRALLAPKLVDMMKADNAGFCQFSVSVIQGGGWLYSQGRFKMARAAIGMMVSSWKGISPQIVTGSSEGFRTGVAHAFTVTDDGPLSGMVVLVGGNGDIVEIIPPQALPDET